MARPCAWRVPLPTPGDLAWAAHTPPSPPTQTLCAGGGGLQRQVAARGAALQRLPERQGPGVACGHVGARSAFVCTRWRCPPASHRAPGARGGRVRGRGAPWHGLLTVPPSPCLDAAGTPTPWATSAALRPCRALQRAPALQPLRAARLLPPPHRQKTCGACCRARSLLEVGGRKDCLGCSQASVGRLTSPPRFLTHTCTPCSPAPSLSTPCPSLHTHSPQCRRQCCHQQQWWCRGQPIG